MKSYEASNTIDAAPERVWEILVDGRCYTAKFARGLKARAEHDA